MEREERRLSREARRDANVNGGNRIWSGLLLLAAGGLLMARQLGAGIPDWMFHWPMLLIAIGLLISFKSGFKNAGGLIMIVIGVAFLLNDIIPNAHMENFLWPGILMIIGVLFIMRPRSHPKQYWKGKWNDHAKDWNNYRENLKTQIVADSTPPQPEPIMEDDAEYIEVNSVFGSVNKLVLSKNFKGGEINAFMGGAEINLTQADIKGPVQLEINTVFGGAKLVVPGSWHVKNEITAVFGGVEDKRNANISSIELNKTLTIKGACVFGGIEIRNF
jgi:predicted membrane protein